MEQPGLRRFFPCKKRRLNKIYPCSSVVVLFHLYQQLMKNITMKTTIFQSVHGKISKNENVEDGCINASEFFAEL